MKTYYSAEDIENFAARGQGEISVDENVVLTDLAKQTAHMLGLRITRKRPGLPPEAAVPSGSPAAVRAPAFSGKPKGCQRRPVQKPAAGGGNPAGPSRPVVDKLVEKIKRINGKSV
jgi:hypothetical protein